MEFVLVVPRSELFSECYPQGFVPFGAGRGPEDFERRVLEHGFFVERARAEGDPALKQIIPYTLISRPARERVRGEAATGTGVEANEVLLLRRLPKGGERRLHHKLSIGIGGHVEPQDAERAPLGRAGLLAACTRRELDEELAISGELEWTPLGIVNDDSNPVGAVHVGLVQLARALGEVSIREEDVLAGEFTPPARLCELHASGADFETWSALLVTQLASLLPPQPWVPARTRAASEALA